MIINKKAKAINFPTNTRPTNPANVRIKSITTKVAKQHTKPKNEPAESNIEYKENCNSIQSTPQPKQATLRSSAPKENAIEEKENQGVAIEKSILNSIPSMEIFSKAAGPIKSGTSYQFSLFNRDEATMLKMKRDQEKQMLKEELEKQILAKKSKKEEEQKRIVQEYEKEQKQFESQVNSIAQSAPKEEDNTHTTAILQLPPKPEVQKPLDIIPPSENILQKTKAHEEIRQSPVIKGEFNENNLIHSKFQSMQSIDVGEWENMKKKIEVLNSENEQLKNAISNINDRKNQSQERIKPNRCFQRRSKVSASANQKTVYERKRKEEEFISELDALNNINTKIQQANERKLQLLASRAPKIQNIKSAGRNLQKQTISKVPLKQYMMNQNKDTLNSNSEGRNLDSVCQSEWVYPHSSQNATSSVQFEDELDLLIKNYEHTSIKSPIIESSKPHSVSINMNNLKMQSPLASAGSISTVPSEVLHKISMIVK